MWSLFLFLLNTTQTCITTYSLIGVLDVNGENVQFIVYIKIM